jgi:hypothetical protein
MTKFENSALGAVPSADVAVECCEEA